MTNMATRVVVAVVAIPIILFVTYIGGLAFCLLVMLVSSIALTEFYSLSQRKGASPLKVLGVIVGIVIVSTFFSNSSFLFFND
jgi:CDP-diglyceride synthetase